MSRPDSTIPASSHHGDMTSPGDIPGLLRRWGIKPSKGLGQNFLIDSHALQKVIDVAEIAPGDSVLEVGAGVGNLTRYLASAARRVAAVELDRKLLPVLQGELAGHPNVQIIAGDILDIEPASLITEPGYLVVANIPYYITSALIRHLLEAEVKPRRVVLTVQLEVAQRICASAGNMSLLALGVQVYGIPGVAARIPAGAFYPPPKVDSAVVRIDLYPQPLIPPPLTDSFFVLAKAGFSQKRKTLRNALSAGLKISPQEGQALLESAGIDPQRRAETLTLDEWRRLTQEWVRPAASTA